MVLDHVLLISRFRPLLSRYRPVTSLASRSLPRLASTLDQPPVPSPLTCLPLPSLSPASEPLDLACPYLGSLDPPSCPHAPLTALTSPPHIPSTLPLLGCRRERFGYLSHHCTTTTATRQLPTLDFGLFLSSNLFFLHHFLVHSCFQL